MIRIRVTWSGLAGGPWISTFYFSDTFNQTNVDAARGGINTLLNTYRSLMAAGATITAATAENLSLAGVLSGSLALTTPINLTSNGAGNWLPREVQALAQVRTGSYLSGRELRGRIYFPQPTTGQADASGNPSTTFQSTMNTALTTYRTTGGFTPVVWSKKFASSSTMSAASIAPYFAVQRRRRD